jgi:hypothetical protein
MPDPFIASLEDLGAEPTHDFPMSSGIKPL